MVAHAFISASGRQGQVHICGFEARLIYRANYADYL